MSETAPPAGFRAVREQLVEAVASGKAPSIAVGVAIDGKTLWAEAFGTAGPNVPATADTSYSLASVSKPITATGLMLLVERGKIDLDAAVNGYLAADARLASHAGDADAVSVRQVAGHTSGLPMHFQFFYEDEDYERPAFDETLRRYAVCMSPPGEVYEYSNLGYGVLDHVIARAAGDSFESFMRDHVFAPLGMRNSSVGVSGDIEGRYADRHFVDGRRIPYYVVDHPGASMLYASANDLLAFGASHLGRSASSILSPDSLAAMRQADLSGESIRSGYGIGWQVSERPSGLRAVAHGGGMPGVRTNLTLFPDEGVVVTLLANNSATAENSLAPIHDEILRELFGNRVGDPANASGLEAATPALVESAAGRWLGTISTWQGDVSLSALLAVDGSVVLQYDRAEMVEARSVLQQGDALVVTGGGAIALTDDLRRAPFEIVLVLRPDGDRLTGRAIARPMRDDERAHFALSHYVELRRES